jgi:hypothetical protein
METITRKPYETDLTDEEWTTLEPILKRALYGEKTKTRAHPKHYPLREIVNAILYLLKTGCQWRQLPHDLPPVEDRLLSLSAVGKAGCAGADPRCTGQKGAGAGGQGRAQALSGAHPYRPSVFYELERRLLKGYPHYRKVFLRRGSYGGVPGLNPDSEFWWR